MRVSVSPGLIFSAASIISTKGSPPLASVGRTSSVLEVCSCMACFCCSIVLYLSFIRARICAITIDRVYFRINPYDCDLCHYDLLTRQSGCAGQMLLRGYVCQLMSKQYARYHYFPR